MTVLTFPARTAVTVNDPSLQHDWRQLMRRVANGDRDAFAILFDHFAPRVNAFIGRSRGSKGLSPDDVVQEVMLKVWQKAPAYRPERGAVSTWIFTIARNALIDQTRSQAHRQTVTGDDLYPEPVDEGESPFEASWRTNIAGRVHEQIGTLPSEQRDVIANVFLKGQTHSEAAAALDIPIGTLKSRIRLAFRKLSIELGRL